MVFVTNYGNPTYTEKLTSRQKSAGTTTQLLKPAYSSIMEVALVTKITMPTWKTANQQTTVSIL